jgi:hypothetical protein
MHPVFAVLIILLIFVGFASGIIWLSWKVPVKLGYPRLGKFLRGLAIAFLSLYILGNVFEDQLFTRGDAADLLNGQQIHLRDKFRLLNNKSMSAPGDYYHTFTLEISDEDKVRIFTGIRNSKNFRFGEPEDIYLLGERLISRRITQNYETDSTLVRRLYEPQEEGYAPIWRVITIGKKEHKLVFEDIDP